MAAALAILVPQQVNRVNTNWLARLPQRRGYSTRTAPIHARPIKLGTTSRTSIGSDWGTTVRVSYTWTTIPLSHWDTCRYFLLHPPGGSHTVTSMVSVTARPIPWDPLGSALRSPYVRDVIPCFASNNAGSPSTTYSGLWSEIAFQRHPRQPKFCLTKAKPALQIDNSTSRKTVSILHEMPPSLQYGTQLQLTCQVSKKKRGAR